jgi:regulator of protease activity HflC (stomatin/prohibitin superfamily)
MSAKPKEYSPIIYSTKRKSEKDFRINVLGNLIFAAACVCGILARSLIGSPLDFAQTAFIALGCLAAAVYCILLPFWTLHLGLIAAGGLALSMAVGEGFLPLFIPIALGVLLAPAVQLAEQWEKVVIVRLGRFRGLRGPGVFLIIPIMDRAARFIDTRIRATDFRAETTLTKDMVVVNVDAIAFWMVWDAHKATLEVEDYLDAVILSAQSALRDAIGKHDLSSLLSERDRLGREIQEILDAKTNPWGVTILSIGITDIIISKELEDALSQQAQAEREHQSRLILGQAEAEVAEKYVEASRRYADNPAALQLRAMNMVYEGIRKNGTVVLLPSPAVQDMALGKIMDDMGKGRKPLEDVAGPRDSKKPTEGGS